MNRAEHRQNTESFYRYQVLLFKIYGLWKLPLEVTSEQRLLYRLCSYSIILGMAILLSGFSITFISNLSSLQVLIKVFFVFSTEISCLSKVLNTKLKSENHSRLIELLHEPVFRPRSLEESNLLRAAELIARKVRDWYGILSFVALNFLMLTQYFVDNTALPLSMYEPCDIRTPFCYYGMYFYQYVAVGTSCFMNIAYDSICVSFLLYLRVQLDILASRLKDLGEAGSLEDNQEISRQLRSSIECYGQILELRDFVEDFIRIPGSIQIFCSVLVLICSFYNLSTNLEDTAAFIKTLVYQLCMMQQIFLICYAANEVTMKSAYLSHALYKSQWQTWNKSNRKLCLMMMLRFDAPINIHTINPTYSFNLAAFTSIVNCSYSYFALLKRVNN